MPTCGECKYYMVGPTNPMKGTCVRERTDYEAGGGKDKVTTFSVTGKLIKRNQEACEHFERIAGGEYGSGGEDSRKDALEHTL